MPNNPHLTDSSGSPFPPCGDVGAAACPALGDRGVVSCRATGTPLRDVLDLGNLHLSGFVRPGDPIPARYPLTLAISDTSGLVQLSHTVDPDLMYRRYWYRSGTNESMTAHLQALAHEATIRADLRPGDTVIDIGANDGTLLRAFPPYARKVAFEPSDIVPVGADVQINGYFSADLYDGPQAKIITSIAMLYDLDDPVKFAADVARVLADDGLWIAEQHWLPAMLDTNDYSVICHEHLTYLSLTALESILQQVGLVVVDVERNAINGGSFRAYIRKQRHTPAQPTRRVAVMRGVEQFMDLGEFARNVERNRQITLALLETYKRQGKLVAGLGASTKFNTILQYCGIRPDLLPFIADRNPDKWGTVTAGSNIPVVSEEDGRARHPDYYLIGPWHFLDSLTRRESEFLANGGKFIVLFPKPRIVE